MYFFNFFDWIIKREMSVYIQRYLFIYFQTAIIVGFSQLEQTGWSDSWRLIVNQHSNRMAVKNCDMFFVVEGRNEVGLVQLFR